jgi:DNA-binding Xre family transcriptional regulator
LRILKGLSLSDFPGITEKEVARIEKGEVKKSHADTMSILGRRFGVRPEEIKTY